MARLDRYRRKRDFDTTPEPAGGVLRKPAEAGGAFIVHKHEARRLHYDLRLEHEGVLESWAVPKGISRRKGDKRLAIHVEDHPIEYGEFEGVIPKGEYGGGTVMLWDRGHFRELRRSEGRIDFQLEGHKLRGAWTLTRMGGKGGGDGKDNWLLIKRSDAGARPAGLERVPDNRSVATGRTMREIAAAGETSRRSSSAVPAPDDVPKARRDKLPDAPTPQLATLADAVPTGQGWIHELKFDGYRIVARFDAGKVRLFSRNAKDWTHRFPEIAGELETLPAAAAVLDGEVVALQKDGTSSFRALQEALSAGSTAPLIYQVFDLIHLDGHDLRASPLLARKRLLEDLLERAGFVASARVRYTDHIEGEGADFYRKACRLSLEGIICKREDAAYRAGRNRNWLKVKCSRHEELVIGGYTDPTGSRSAFGALLLGGHDADGRLIYAGKVGTGFDQQQLQTLGASLRKLERRTCPFESCPEARGVHWVRPALVAEVEFTEWTRDGMLRHPAFRGLREDKEPEEVRMPPVRQQAPAEPAAGSRRAARPAPQDGDRVAGVRLSNPDRILFPEQGVTKAALAQYYVDIADWILPHLRRRPLALVRCPQGRGKQCFFQKHPGDSLSDQIPRVAIREKDGKADYVYVEDASHLVALVQVGVLELHAWGSRVNDLERPDIVVFDLDPGEDVRWQAVVRTARDLRDRIEALGLTSFLRTTGGKGLHLVVPLAPKLHWDEVKGFARAVAERHAEDDPRRLTTNMSKAQRKGRVFLDYLRNGRGATAIASYSTRARPGATVAVPVRWDELSTALTSDRYHVGNVRRRLASLGSDPWDGFDDARRPITRRILSAVGAESGGRR